MVHCGIIVITFLCWAVDFQVVALVVVREERGLEGHHPGGRVTAPSSSPPPSSFKPSSFRSLNTVRDAVTDSSSPSFISNSNTFSINIRSSKGSDLSSLVSIRYHQHQVSNSQQPSSSLDRLTKRAHSRAMNICDPPEPLFLGSVCLRFLSAQAYAISCSENGYHPAVAAWTQNTCAPDEICVDGIRWPSQAGPIPFTAYCVSTENFVQIAQGQLQQQGQGSSSSVDVVTELNPPAAASASDTTGCDNTSSFPSPSLQKHYYHAVEAVLTSASVSPPSISANLANTSSIKSVFAQNLTITAETYSMRSNTHAWEPMINGTNQCADCASIGILPVPEGAQRVRVDVVVEGEMEGEGEAEKEREGEKGFVLYLAELVSP